MKTGAAAPVFLWVFRRKPIAANEAKHDGVRLDGRLKNAYNIIIKPAKMNLHRLAQEPGVRGAD